MKKHENLLNYDFQGWPVYRLTLREMLESLGFELIQNEGNDYLRIRNDNPILDLTPRVLDDDGMGYGVNEKWVVDAHAENDKLTIFTDTKDNDLEE